MNKEESAAYHSAMRLLVRREYCRVEMRQKLLTREFDENVIDVVLEKLKDDGYLSESRFAEMYLRSRLDKGEALWLAAQRAKQKGADAQCIELALDELSQDYDAEGVVRGLLAMRDPAGFRFEDERVWQRQARFLRNKGFATDIILRVLKEPVEDSH